MATHIVRSHRDLAKPYLQVVHSGVLASSDPPVSPRPIHGHTCALDFRHCRLQRCFAHLLEQAPPLATHIVRSHRDLAKPYLQVVHSSALASSDPPFSPRPIKGHTFASGLGPCRLQRRFAQKLAPNELHICGGFLSRGF